MGDHPTQFDLLSANGAQHRLAILLVEVFVLIEASCVHRVGNVARQVHDLLTRLKLKSADRAPAHVIAGHERVDDSLAHGVSQSLFDVLRVSRWWQNWGTALGSDLNLIWHGRLSRALTTTMAVNGASNLLQVPIELKVCPSSTVSHETTNTVCLCTLIVIRDHGPVVVLTRRVVGSMESIRAARCKIDPE